jgi:hypothetical protein
VNTNPGGWNQRVVSALVLILAIAFVGHWAFTLLHPVVPFAVSGVVTALVISAVLRRRRW